MADLVAIQAGSYHRGPLIVLTCEVSERTGKKLGAEFHTREGLLMSKTSTTLGQLAEFVGGRVQGDPKLPIYGAAVLGEVVAGEITLVDHVERLNKLDATQATAVVLAEKIVGEFLHVELNSKHSDGPRDRGGLGENAIAIRRDPITTRRRISSH